MQGRIRAPPDTEERMPHILPPGGAVDWPADEGTIGVVGVAPWATIDFLRALYAQVSATRDWHYPRVIADINTKLPSRGRHLELGETDPSPFIAQTVNELAAQGASVVVVPCNTAHVLYERWSAGSPVPVPSIIEATVRDVLDQDAHRVACFTSASLRTHDLYGAALRRAGAQAIDTGDAGAALVSDVIAAVKLTGRVDDALTARVRALLAGLANNGVDGIVLGCTELAALEPLCTELVGRVAESNRSLARAALQIARGTQPAP
jgi:aspartate racemase